MRNKYTYKALPAGVKFMLAVSLFLFASCREQRKERGIERSFYYWKSVLRFSPGEISKMDSLGVKTLYVKYFDVDWDPGQNRPVPVAKLRSAGTGWPFSKWAIPVVFITNNCLQQIDSTGAQLLAHQICKLVGELTQVMDIRTLPELQIDCDWTASTKDRYFSLLREIRKVNPITTISVTIRLHQVKFTDRTGIPPADRGLLMCYNMGNLKNPATVNSILETKEVEKYTGLLEYYPLPLDIGLPLFNWKVLFRDNVYKGLIQELPGHLLTPSFTIREGNRYVFLKDTVLQGYEFRRGDLLRDEQSSYSEILKTAAYVSQFLKNTSTRVSLYHLDSVLLSKYSLHELETVFDRFR